MTRDERRVLFEAIRRDACERQGALPAATRLAAAGDAPLAGALGALIDRVRHAAAMVTDADIEAARREGHDDDALYEATVATALGQSQRRLDAILRLLGRGI